MARTDPNAYAREWRKKNREKNREYMRQWKKNNPGKIQAAVRRTLSKKKAEGYCVGSKSWVNNLKYIYGITEGEYLRMRGEQGNRCYLCGDEETVVDKRRGKVRELAIDHDHETGRVRHLLCHRCNIAIGLIRENPLLAEKIAAYLRSENAR